jgi:hypothetical protein
MRKTSRRLALHRETLAELTRLRDVQGGTNTTTSSYCPSITCQPPCDFSNGRNTCATCESVCTTNYC